MSKEIGVVKNVTQGSVKAVSPTGESRELKVGDIVYQGEKIVTETTDAKVVIAKADGKEISLIGKDSINLDQSVSENSQTTADINSLQKAILGGQDLNALEETAAGGNQAGGNAGGDGVSLGAASFAQGGHYSNISANFNNLGDLGATFEAPVSSVGGGQGENLGDGAAADNVAPQPPLPPQPNGIIKIPLSAHKGEDPAAELIPAFTTKIPSGYSVQKQADGRSYLVPDDGVNEFTYNNGWYVSNDGQLAIGQDEAKKLAVTSNANEGNYPDDGTVAKIVAPNAQLNVFGSDINDKIVVDNAKINNVYGGVGVDEISGINSAKLSNISGGSGDDVVDLNKTTITGIVVGNEGDDTINVDNGSKVAKSVYGNDGKDTITIDNSSVVSKNVFGNAGEDTIVVQGGAKVDGWVLGDTKTKNDMHEKQVNPSLDITDNGAGNDTIKISGAGTSVKNIGGGNGDDTITVENGARVVLIQADEGNDEIIVTDTGTYVEVVNGRGGDDKILIENGSKVYHIRGLWGNDEITVRGKGTTVIENIEGREDADTIKILDGATVQGSVIGGRGENPSVYGGAQDSDKDKITIKNATVKGNVEGSINLGDDTLNVENSVIGGKILSGYGKNIINIKDMDFSEKNIEGNVFVDELNLNDGAVLGQNGKIIMGKGEDTININSGSRLKGTHIYTGNGKGHWSEESDQDTINFNKGSSVEAVKVDMNNGNDSVNIDTTINNSRIRTFRGDDTVNINSKAVLNFINLDTSEGNDILDIKAGSNINQSSFDLGAGDDRVKIAGHIKDGYMSLGDGYNTLDIEDSAIFEGLFYITGGSGSSNLMNVHGTFKDDTGLDGGWNSDEINFYGKVENSIGRINGSYGDDIIKIKSTAQIDGTSKDDWFSSFNIKGDDGDDVIKVENGAKVNNAAFLTGAGNDTIIIEKGAKITNSWFVGSSKTSKLHIEENDAVDFSRVENFTNLELGGADKNLNITLTKDDIFRNNELKIDGEEGDKVTLKGGFTEAGSSNGYNKYTGTQTDVNGIHTISIEIKAGVDVDLV